VYWKEYHFPDFGEPENFDKWSQFKYGDYEFETVWERLNYFTQEWDTSDKPSSIEDMLSVLVKWLTSDEESYEEPEMFDNREKEAIERVKQAIKNEKWSV